MYTSCPNCNTIYEISREHLGIAQGDVRCGECDTTFNALNYLSQTVDEKPLYREPLADQDDPIGGTGSVPLVTPAGLEDEQGTAMLARAVELAEQRTEAPKDSAPQEESPEAATSDDPAKDERSAGETDEEAPEQDTAEFTGTATISEGLDAPREFAVQRINFDDHVAGYVAASDEEADEGTGDGEEQAPTLDSASPGELQAHEPNADSADTAYLSGHDGDDDDEPQDERADEDETSDEDDSVGHDDLDWPEPAAVAEAQTDSHSARSADSPSDHDSDTPDVAAELAAMRRMSPQLRRRSTLWGAVAGVAVLGLLLQITHNGRARWLQNPTLGPVLYRLYEKTGLKDQMIFDVARYQFAATVEQDTRPLSEDALPDTDRLLVATRITNRAPIPQPAPVLRIRLQDRWGKLISANDFAPEQYLPFANPANKMIAPGERLRINLPITNPGEPSTSFNVDLCLPAKEGLRCLGS